MNICQSVTLISLCDNFSILPYLFPLYLYSFSSLFTIFPSLFDLCSLYVFLDFKVLFVSCFQKID
jgi:hypothetical protein